MRKRRGERGDSGGRLKGNWKEKEMASTTLHIDDGESTEITITIPYERGHALLSLYKVILSFQ
uniref:Uncharacterized protein n=1 Tax=Timema tahoe TaxID=61484 RepID=A0A7R9NZD8_9NEOP|nr:unnamed protein product [Timema tahoe]